MINQSCGKTTRLGRIFNHESGRALVVALDHGLVGTLPGIENLPETLDKVLQGKPDAIVISAGAMTNLSTIIQGKLGIILTLDTFLSSSIPRSKSMGEEHRILATAEKALFLGADAAKVFLIGGQGNLGSFADNINRIAEMAQMCNQIGLPLIIEPTLWGNMVENEQKHDPELVGHMCRIAFECGADVLKIPNPGKEALSKLSKDIPCPILIMGGSRLGSEKQMIDDVRDALEAGAAGIVYGQYVWQRDNPAGIIQELSKVVHAS